MFGEWPSSRPLRSWQDRALTRYLLHKSRDFMLVGTPGAGKTTFALRVAHEGLRSGRVRCVVVVCPTEHLKKQWADDAARVGIQLDPKWSNGLCALSDDFHGAVVTYAQVASNPHSVRLICGPSALVILDEIHHAGDSNSWGDSIRLAFDAAARRLAMSGTPFRTDNNPIPFVRYDASGVSQVDFSYSYADALADSVCRPVLFPSYEGDMAWYSRGRKFSASFAESLSEAKASHRLRTALDPSGKWLPEVLRDADAKLTQVRAAHPDAAGLALAIDKEHAVAIGHLLEKIAGEPPVVVKHDDPGSSDAIEAFGKGRRRWIVSIRMVSEGVDIPRLRVGVYATNILTEMYFRQAVGRFVRMMDGVEDQNAYFYIPKEAMLVEFALKIMEERDHQLEEALKAVRDSVDRERDIQADDDKVASVFVPISSTGRADDIFFNQAPFSQKEKEEAEVLMRDLGVPAWYDPVVIAMILRKSRGPSAAADGSTATTAASEPPPQPLHVQKEAIKKIIRRLVATIVEATDGAFDYSAVYTELMKRDGADQKMATLDQLNARVEYLETWLEALRHGR